MKRMAWVLLGMALVFAASEVRVIRVEGGRLSGDLRYGPWVFEGEVRGRVKDLTILAPKATLIAPKGKTMQEAEGEREARFEGGVVVRRGRVEARGPALVYRESTGEGVLLGPARMRQEPKPGEDPVEVEAARMTFQVDTDTSTSENALLKSGNQEGRAGLVYYEEERGLAVFTDPKEVVLVRKRKDGDLRIRAKEVRPQKAHRHRGGGPRGRRPRDPGGEPLLRRHHRGGHRLGEARREREREGGLPAFRGNPPPQREPPPGPRLRPRLPPAPGGVQEARGEVGALA